MTRTKRAKQRRRIKPVSVRVVGERAGGKLKVTAFHGGKKIHFDVIEFDRAPQRERFVRAVCQRLPAADRAAVEAALLKVSTTLPAPETPDGATEPEVPPVKVMMTYLPGSNGRAGTLAANLKGETIHLDNRIDPATAGHRQRFLKAVAGKCPSLDQADGEAQLLNIAQQVQTRPESNPAPVNSPDGRNAAALLAAMPQGIRDEAESMLADPLLIQRVIDDVAKRGVAGERELIATTYLIGVSRLLDRPLAGIVQGPSSSGKSYVIEKAAEFFPGEAVLYATQMTPQALFHMRPGTLAHRFIVAGERSRLEDDERAEATRALREMLSAGKLTKLMPVKVEGGRIETALIEQDGPIAYVESTTLARVFDEDANRCLMLHTDEQPEQTRRIIKSLAESYKGSSAVAANDRIVQRHHALQRMLRRQPVAIPYAERLGELFPTDRVEVRRAFPQLMSMVQSVTLLYQRQRQEDADGRLIATAEDYLLAWHLLLKPMTRLLGGGLSDPARRFFDRLAAWATGEFTSAEAKKHETSSKSAVYGWLAELHDAGLVDLVEQSRGRAPATWRLSGKTPDDSAGGSLPALGDLFPDSDWTHGRKPEDPASL